MKYKHIYDITHPTSFGIGCQPMKGNTKAEARERFKKRFPKKSIISIDKRDSPLHSWNKAMKNEPENNNDNGATERTIAGSKEGNFRIYHTKSNCL